MGSFRLRYSCFPRRLELGRASSVPDRLGWNVSALGTPTSLDALDLDRLLRWWLAFGIKCFRLRYSYFPGRPELRQASSVALSLWLPSHLKISGGFNFVYLTIISSYWFWQLSELSAMGWNVSALGIPTSLDALYLDALLLPGTFRLRYSCFPRRLELGGASSVPWLHLPYNYQQLLVATIIRSIRMISLSALGTLISLDVLNLDELLLSLLVA